MTLKGLRVFEHVAQQARARLAKNELEFKDTKHGWEGEGSIIDQWISHLADLRFQLRKAERELISARREFEIAQWGAP